MSRLSFLVIPVLAVASFNKHYVLGAGILVFAILGAMHFDSKRKSNEAVLMGHLKRDAYHAIGGWQYLERSSGVNETSLNRNALLKTIHDSLTASPELNYDSSLRSAIVEAGGLRARRVSRFQSNLSLIESTLRTDFNKLPEPEKSVDAQILITDVKYLSSDSARITYSLFCNWLSIGYPGVYIMYGDILLDALPQGEFVKNPELVHVVVENYVTCESRTFHIKGP